jgi:DNA polymerase III alpha subunit (gram-positive type)
VGNKTPVVTAHNAHFDRNMVSLPLVTRNLSPPKWEWMCSGLLSRHILNLPRAKGNSTLQSLAERFKITVTNAHRANGDVDVLWQIIQHLVDAKNEAAVEKWIFIMVF